MRSKKVVNLVLVNSFIDGNMSTSEVRVANILEISKSLSCFTVASFILYALLSTTRYNPYFLFSKAKVMKRILQVKEKVKIFYLSTVLSILSTPSQTWNRKLNRWSWVRIPSLKPLLFSICYCLPKLEIVQKVLKV